VLDNENNISIIEWPDLLKNYYKPTIEIFLEKTDNEFERNIDIIYHK
jgi:tRNA A37 threonylcarbamoyladenosine biosynthesis protein TsaE